MPLPIALFLLAAGAVARWYGRSRSLEEGTKAQYRWFHWAPTLRHLEIEEAITLYRSLFVTIA
jgi:hypothetical protein